MTLEFLYIVACMASIVACVPQLRQLINTKRSDEFNLRAWIQWAFTQIVSLFYVISIGDVLLIAFNVAWVSYYLMMLVLIIRYRARPQAVAYAEEAPKA